MSRRVLATIMWTALGIAFMMSSLASAQEKLVMWSRPHAGYFEAHQAIAELYMQKNPGMTVEVMSGFDDALLVRLAGGVEIDVIMLNAAPTWTDTLLDLTPFISTDPDPPHAHIPPALMEATTVNGRVLGIPAYWFTSLIIYNVDLFQEAGLEEPPENWTWDDFRMIAQRLTRDTDSDGNPEVWGAGFSGRFAHVIRPWLWGAGGDFFDDELTRSTAASREALAAWEFAYDLAAEFRAVPGWSNAARSQVSPWFDEGKVAIKNGTQQSVPSDSTGITYDVALRPVGPSGKAANHVILTFMGVNAGSKRPHEAYKFAKFIASEEAQRYARARAIETGSQFANTPVANMTMSLEDYRPSAARPYNTHLWFEGVVTGKDVDRTPKGVTVTNIDTIVQRYWVQVEAGDMSVAEAANNIQLELNALLSNAGQ